MKQMTVIRKITCLFFGFYILGCLNVGCITEASLLDIDLGSLLSCLIGNCISSTTKATTAKSTTVTSTTTKAVSAAQTKSSTTTNKGLQGNASVTSTLITPDTTQRPKAAVVVQTTEEGLDTTPNPKAVDVVQTTAADPIMPLQAKTTTAPGCPVVMTTSADRNCFGDNLTHTVVYEGVVTTLSIPDNGQNAFWQFVPSSDAYSVIKNMTNCGDDVLKPAFNGAYALNRTSLTIFNATTTPSKGSTSYSTAGLYILRHWNPNCTTAANLIVIKTGLACACNTTNPSNVTLSCSVIFAQSYIQPCNPIFKWMNANGVQVKQEQTIMTQVDAFTRRSKSQLSIASDDTATYQCQLTFSAPPKSPFYYVAPTPPKFRASCSISRV